MSSIRFSYSQTSTPRKSRESAVTQHMKDIKRSEFEEKCTKLRNKTKQVDEYSSAIADEYERTLDIQTHSIIKSSTDFNRIMMTPPSKRMKNLNLPKFSPSSPYLKKKESTEGLATPPMMKYFPMSI